MLRNLLDLANHGLLESRLGVIQLKSVRPSGEVWIPAVSQHDRLALEFHAVVVLRFLLEAVFRSLNVELPMLNYPWMVESCVVWHKVKQQFHAPAMHAIPEAIQCGVASESGVGLVHRDGKTGTADI